MSNNELLSPPSSHVQRIPTDAATPSRAKPPRSRSYPSSRSRRCERKLWRIKLATGATGVIFLILLVLAKFEIEGLEAKNQYLNVQSRKQAIQIEQTRQQLGALRQDVQTLVQNRIPNLHRLEFDKTIPIDERYVRNIIFTLTGVGGDRQYEYRIVMHNDSYNVVRPLVDVFLFDELGIQVGATRIADSKTATRVAYPDLQPGETRSYSAMVPRDRDATPGYFLLSFKE